MTATITRKKKKLKINLNTIAIGCKIHFDNQRLFTNMFTGSRKRYVGKKKKNSNLMRT